MTYHFLKILISAHAWTKMSLKHDASGKERHAFMLQMPFWVDWSYFGPIIQPDNLQNVPKTFSME